MPTPPDPTTEHGLLARFPLDAATMSVVHDANGAPLFVANEIGVALGYEERSFRTLMGQEWSDRLRPCDVTKLSGADLAPLKASGVVAPNASSLVLLTESGLYRVLMLSGKPAALRLQEWLADDVLPALRKTGTYGTPSLLSAKIEHYLTEAQAAGDWRAVASLAKTAATQRNREAKIEAKKAKFAFELRRLEIACDAPVRARLSLVPGES